MFSISSVDVMVSSVAENFGRDTLGVIMTGMGSDGLQGLRSEVKEKGGRCNSTGQRLLCRIRDAKISCRGWPSR